VGDRHDEALAAEVAAALRITPELVAELAKSAKVVRLVHPGDAPPEAGYVPSKALADFVRCRDLTCRWPGCDHPAIHCDVDHTIPHSQGWAHARGEPQVLLPDASSVENFRWVARYAVG
jgi:hypothetical protein